MVFFLIDSPDVEGRIAVTSIYSSSAQRSRMLCIAENKPKGVIIKQVDGVFLPFLLGLVVLG